MKLLIHFRTWTVPFNTFGILGMHKQFQPTFYQACDYLSKPGSKLNHVSKGVQGRQKDIYLIFHALGKQSQIYRKIISNISK